MDGWKTSFLLGRPIIRGYVMLISGSVVINVFGPTEIAGGASEFESITCLENQMAIGSLPLAYFG